MFKKILFYLLRLDLLYHRVRIMSNVKNISNKDLLIKKNLKKKNYFNAFYDLNFNSKSFNFFSFLILCEIFKEKNDYNYFNVFVLENNLPEYLKHKSLINNLGKNIYDLRNFNLLPSLCSLFVNCNSYSYVTDRQILNLKKINEIDKFPENYPKTAGVTNGFDTNLHSFFRLNNGKLKNYYSYPKYIDSLFREYNIKKKIITFTIRNSKFDKFRNTNQSDLNYVIDHIDKNEFEIIILPDSENTDIIDPLKKFVTHISLSAIMSLAYRLKLYKEAFLNIFSDNGPFDLALYSKDINYIFMRKTIGSEIHNKNNNNLSGLYNEDNQIHWSNERQIVLDEEKNKNDLVKCIINFKEKFYEEN